MKTDPLFWPLLDRYLARDATPEEQARVEQWLAANPAGARALRAMEAARERQLLMLDAAPVTEQQVADVIARVQERTTPPARIRRPSTLRGRSLVQSGYRSRAWRTVWAGSVLAVMLIGMGVWWRLVASRTTTPAVRSYATLTGQHASFTLPDGSHVVLAPESQLEYRNARGNARHIKLQGQAYFTVTHDPAQPFHIQTGAIVTQVLGTSFGVQRYATDTTAIIAVADGKVAVINRQSRTVITPGTTAFVTDSSASLHRDSDIRGATAWINGDLVFDDVPVPAMLKTLGRWYGYTFTLVDSTLSARHVSVTFSTQNPTETMNILKGVLGVDLVIRRDTVLLRPASHPLALPRMTPGGQRMPLPPSQRPVVAHTARHGQDQIPSEAGK